MPTPKDQSETYNPSEALTTKEAAAIAGVSVRRLRKWVEAGRLRAVQRHPKMLIDRQMLEEFLRNRQQSPDTDNVSQALTLILDEALTTETHNSPKRLTVREAAAVAGVHRATIAKWVARGDLRAAQREPQISIDRDELDQFLRNRKEQSVEAVDALSASSLTLEQASEIASVHRTTIGNWIASGKLRTVQRKPLILIDREDFDQFLRQKEQADSDNYSSAEKVLPIARSPRITVDRPTENALVFSRKDAAVLLGVHPDTINRWRREGRLDATPEGSISLAEIERIVAANRPASGTQLELLREPTSQASEDVGEQSSAWLLLARLLEAERQRVARLEQQLDVANDLLNRTFALLEIRSIQPSGQGQAMEVPLTNRVLTFLQSYPGPHSSAEIRQALDLPDSPRDALNKLVERDLIKRLSPGVFEAIPESSKSAPPLEPAEGTLMAQVLTYVREVTGEGSSRRGILSWQVQQALDLPKSPNRTLSRLRERGLIYRIREGVYSSRPLEIDEREEDVEEGREEED